MGERKHRFRGFAQRLYITWDAFMTNDLFTYASAGAYSFFLSAFPLLLMVLAVLIRIFRTSPQVIADLLESTGLLQGTLNLEPFLQSVTAIQSIGIFEIVLGLSVFWMARRFFAAIQQGMNVIYRKRGKGKPIKENLIVIAGEVVLVILIVLMVIFIVAGNAFFRTALSGSILGPFEYALVSNLFRFAPLAITFTFLFLVYYVTPRLRPPAEHSLFASAICTLSFAVVRVAFASFVNLSRYNLVYGILSNVIVLLLEVYLFFFLFLFFAQFQFVSQFFEGFLLAQLYLMPAWDDPNPVRQLERMMFIEPPLFYRRYATSLKAGTEIFALGEETTELYYVCQGLVHLKMPNQVLEIGRGRVFGEFASIAGGHRTATATAVTDSVLLKLPARLFQETIEVDADLSRRTLQMIADYVRKQNKMATSSEE